MGRPQFVSDNYKIMSTWSPHVIKNVQPEIFLKIKHCQTAI